MIKFTIKEFKFKRINCLFYYLNQYSFFFFNKRLIEKENVYVKWTSCLLLFIHISVLTHVTCCWEICSMIWTDYFFSSLFACSNRFSVTNCFTTKSSDLVDKKLTAFYQNLMCIQKIFCFFPEWWRIFIISIISISRLGKILQRQHNKKLFYK